MTDDKIDLREMRTLAVYEVREHVNWSLSDLKKEPTVDIGTPIRNGLQREGLCERRFLKYPDEMGLINLDSSSGTQPFWLLDCID